MKKVEYWVIGFGSHHFINPAKFVVTNPADDAVFLNRSPMKTTSLAPHSAASPLRSGDSLATAGADLTGVQPLSLLLKSIRSLLNKLRSLGQDNLDVGRVGHVRVDLEPS
jgi:hypothetical protein